MGCLETTALAASLPTSSPWSTPRGRKRSSGLESSREETISGFNEYPGTLKKPGERRTSP